MANVKINIGANLIGNIWQVFIGFIFVPLYIRFMGVEAYGLVGIFLTLQVIAGMLDMGLGGTMNREMARRSVLSGDSEEMRDLVRSLEIIYWGAALVIGVVIIMVSPLISQYWIKGDNLSQQTITQAIAIMGLIMIIHWPASLYANGLFGLQKHVLLSAINICLLTVRGIGAVLILWLISPTVQAFFLWQIFISVIHTSLLLFFLWRNLPAGQNKAAFQMKLVKSISRFAAGVASITILSVIITQIDKIILSKMLTLEAFGYYTLAGIVAMSPLRIAWPVFSGIYPKFTQLVSVADYEGLEQIYHKASQLMAVLILPFTVVVAFFSYELILLWTQNQLIADKTHILASIIICGTAFGCIMLVPHALQLSSGWTRLLFYKNLIAVIIMVPLIIYMTNVYGAIGAAVVWLLLNLLVFLIEISIMHRRLLPGNKWRWYTQDVFIPLVTALIITGIGKLLMPAGISKWMILIYLLAVSATALTVTSLITPTTRKWIFMHYEKIKLAVGE